MTSSRRVLSFVVAIATLCAALPARAQDAPPAGGLQVTQIKEGFLVAPDVRFTSINDRAATLLGAYGGYEIDRTMLVGGAAYWLVNRDDDFKAQYGGFLFRWTAFGQRAFAVSPGVLVGFGTATLSRSYADLYGTFDAPPPNNRPGRNPPRINGNAAVWVHDGFGLAEPQLNALWRLAPWLRIDAGVSYRFVGSSELIEDEVSGVSGSLGLRISY